MTIRLVAPLLLLLVSAELALAQQDQDPKAFDVAKAYEQIVADYQRIAATNSPSAVAAAGRLVTYAYQNVIDRAAVASSLDASDLYALGACHEGLGALGKAKELFAQSLKQEARPRTHLAVVRVHLEDDLELADKHFAAAEAMDPGYASLRQFRVALANAHARRQDWRGAADYLERYMDFTKSLAEDQPGNPSIVAAHKVVETRLQTLRRFAKLVGKPAPALKTKHWAQGEAATLAALRGQVVLVDFCAMWAAPSRARMERLKKLHAKYANKGLEVIGVTLEYGLPYDSEKDQFDGKGERSPVEERADLRLFAKKHEIGYRLGVIDRATTEAYAVNSLPHTVVLDHMGQVKMILQTGDKEDEAQLEAIIRELLSRN